jgi:endonuclease G, mitochondrial
MKKKYILLLLPALLLIGGTASAGRDVYPKSDDFQPPLVLLENKFYSVGYNVITKNPHWVYYFVSKQHTPAGGERPGYFSSDNRVPDPVVHDDYTNSGYDRGHMAPNYILGAYGGVTAQEETFIMTNVIPQTPELNRGPWKELEMLIAKTYVPEFDYLYIFTGPVYKAAPGVNDKLESGVWIPDGCYKIVVDVEGFEFRVLAFLFPQNGPYTDLEDYLVSVDCIERLTGLDFLSDLPDSIEEPLEAVKQTRLWQVPVRG